MSNPLVKHYLIALFIGALTYIATHLFAFAPDAVNGSLSVVVTYFVHHYLENSESTINDPTVQMVTSLLGPNPPPAAPTPTVAATPAS